MNIALGKFTIELKDIYIDYPIDFLKDEITKILEEEIGIPMKYIQKNCDDEYIDFVVSSYLSKHPLRNPNLAKVQEPEAPVQNATAAVTESIIEEIPEGLVTESVIEIVKSGINQNPEIAAVEAATDTALQNEVIATAEETTETVNSETNETVTEEAVTAEAEETVNEVPEVKDDAVSEETTADAPVAEEVKEEAPVAEEVKDETPVTEEVKEEAPVAEEVKEEAPVAEEVKEKAPVAEEVKEEAPAAEETKQNLPNDESSSEMMIAEPELLSKKPVEKTQEITLDQFKNLTVSILLMGEEKRRSLFGTSDTVEIFKRNSATQIADKFGIFTCSCGTDICYIEANIPKGEKFEIKCPKCGKIHIRTKKAKSSTPSVISIVGA